MTFINLLDVSHRRNEVPWYLFSLYISFMQAEQIAYLMGALALQTLDSMIWRSLSEMTKNAFLFTSDHKVVFTHQFRFWLSSL